MQVAHQHLLGSRADKLTVLHVGKYFPPYSGGMESFLADLLRTLAREGLKTLAVVHDHRAQLRRKVTWELANGGAHRDESGQPGGSLIRVCRVPSFGRLIYAPVSPQFPLWLRKVIRGEHPDILHLHLPNTSAFWALYLPEARRIPWVIHWHADVVASDVDRRLKYAYLPYRRLEQQLLLEAEAVVVTSPPYLDNSQPLAPWHGKCNIVPLGLDSSRLPKTSERARQSAELFWGNADFRILSVGRLTYYKGHEYLIRALRDVPGALAVIIGKGERRRLLANLISRLELDDHVVLTGDVPSEQLHALMATCDCLCLPSIERTEAFGMVLLEAMAHGKPTVVSDIEGSGATWVVQNGETGVVVPPAEPAALSAAFRMLATEREMSYRMGQRGRLRYEDMFHIDRVGQKITRLYEHVLHGRRRQ